MSEQETSKFKLNLENLVAILENTSDELLSIKTEYDKTTREFNLEWDKIKADLTLTNKELDNKTSDLSKLNRGFDQEEEKLKRRIEEKTIELIEEKKDNLNVFSCALKRSFKERLQLSMELIKAKEVIRYKEEIAEQRERSYRALMQRINELHLSSQVLAKQFSLSEQEAKKEEEKKVFSIKFKIFFQKLLSDELMKNTNN